MAIDDWGHLTGKEVVWSEEVQHDFDDLAAMVDALAASVKDARSYPEITVCWQSVISCLEDKLAQYSHYPGLDGIRIRKHFWFELQRILHPLLYVGIRQYRSEYNHEETGDLDTQVDAHHEHVYHLVSASFEHLLRLQDAQVAWRSNHDDGSRWRDLIGFTSFESSRQQVWNFAATIRYIEEIAGQIPPLQRRHLLGIKNRMTYRLSPVSGFRKPGHEVVYGDAQGCPAEEIDARIEHLLAVLNHHLEDIKQHKYGLPIRYAMPPVMAQTIRELIQIHPFGEGNGRDALGLLLLLRKWAGMRIPERLREPKMWDMGRLDLAQGQLFNFDLRALFALLQIPHTSSRHSDTMS
jgi:hypothetical protein